MMLRVFIFLLATIVSAMADGYRGHIGYGSNGYSTGLIMPPIYDWNSKIDVLYFKLSFFEY